MSSLDLLTAKMWYSMLLVALSLIKRYSRSAAGFSILCHVFSIVVENVDVLVAMITCMTPTLYLCTVSRTIRIL